MSWCSEHGCPDEVCERSHRTDVHPSAARTNPPADGDDGDDGDDVPADKQPIRSGIGCAVAVIGLAIAFCLVQWAMRGFPKVWQ